MKTEHEIVNRVYGSKMDAQAGFTPVNNQPGRQSDHYKHQANTQQFHAWKCGKYNRRDHAQDIKHNGCRHHQAIAAVIPIDLFFGIGEG